MPPRDGGQNINRNVTMTFEDGSQVEIPDIAVLSIEMADEDEYVATAPITFDELMGGDYCDN